MKLETFKRQNRNKELEKAKPQTEGDKKPSKSPKKAPESQCKRPVVATVIKPAVETKEVEEKEERITAVTPSPKRSLSDSSEVKDRGSPVKPEVKKSVSVGEISRKSYRDFMQRQGPTQLGTKQLPEVKKIRTDRQTDRQTKQAAVINLNLCRLVRIVWKVSRWL